jgi:phosphate ABC transporter phosphate-binding protein
MRRNVWLVTLGLLAVLTTIIGCPHGNETGSTGGSGPHGGASSLKGGGSTLVGPMMEEWRYLYEQEKGVKVDYTLGGSGRGISSMAEGLYDFGCTDAYLTEKEKETASKGPVLQIPLVLGALVPAYNLQVDQQLKFTGAVLADIYLGKITHWNDPALAALNPGVALPDQKIVVVRRSEPSGSTFIWTNYLTKVSEAWKPIGFGKEVKWPPSLGDGARGTDGVTALIAQTPGALGYIEVLYALKNSGQIKFGTVRNRKGKDVAGDNVEAVTAAALVTLKEIPDDLTFTVTDADGDDSYPICGVVWAVLYEKQPPDKAQALADFLHWVVHDGQKHCAKLSYAPLPPGLVERIDQKLEKLR